MILHKSNPLTFFGPNETDSLGALFFDTGISAGYPAPTEDFSVGQRLSLDSELVKNKETTFYARVSGQSMIGAGLDDNDLLVIDRSIAPTNNKDFWATAGMNSKSISKSDSQEIAENHDPNLV